MWASKMATTSAVACSQPEIRDWDNPMCCLCRTFFMSPGLSLWICSMKSCNGVPRSSENRVNSQIYNSFTTHIHNSMKHTWLMQCTPVSFTGVMRLAWWSEGWDMWEKHPRALFQVHRSTYCKCCSHPLGRFPSAGALGCGWWCSSRPFWWSTEPRLCRSAPRWWSAGPWDTSSSDTWTVWDRCQQRVANVSVSRCSSSWNRVIVCLNEELVFRRCSPCCSMEYIMGKRLIWLDNRREKRKRRDWTHYTLTRYKRLDPNVRIGWSVSYSG